jgi:hypothetical protein
MGVIIIRNIESRLKGSINRNCCIFLVVYIFAWRYPLYNTSQPSVTFSTLCLTFPNPHEKWSLCSENWIKNLSLEVPFCFVFSEWLTSIRYINVVLFIIWSLTYHNSRHINIEKDTAPCTAELQKPKFTNLYQMDQLWWELHNRECGESLTDVKSDGTNIEKV